MSVIEIVAPFNVARLSVTAVGLPFNARLSLSIITPPIVPVVAGTRLMVFLALPLYPVLSLPI